MKLDPDFSRIRPRFDATIIAYAVLLSSVLKKQGQRIE